MITMPLHKLQSMYSRKSYKFFDGDKPYNLNLFGIRFDNPTVNRFDDIIGAAYRDESLAWNIRLWYGTTDPGSYWLENPMNVNGTAILVPGQHRGAWKVGMHRGKYPALVQCKRLPVYRDDNKDEVMDMNPDTVQTGLFGINIHRASEHNISTEVNKWSAGCQVIQKSTEHTMLMELCGKQVLLYGDSFTYTLFEEEDYTFNKE